MAGCQTQNFGGIAVNHYDVVVLGGGNAGLCAALSAAESGAKVVVLELTAVLDRCQQLGISAPYTFTVNALLKGCGLQAGNL
ncbi:FAD-binding protein [Marinobacter sp. SS5-14b]|uniref:FAD-binding protein n=1 Tax=Marinobacter sp. SS5-14b TaxID=3050456 RepID=UPI0026DF7E08|nr:FAD-binding protein [Marinobacter sp. SS5-14b]